jgi:hypothetical protein
MLAARLWVVAPPSSQCRRLPIESTASAMVHQAVLFHIGVAPTVDVDKLINASQIAVFRIVQFNIRSSLAKHSANVLTAAFLAWCVAWLNFFFRFH